MTGDDTERSGGDLAEVVRAVIAEAAGRPVSEVGDDVDLYGLGLDSLDLTSVLIDVEDALDMDIPVDAIEVLFQRDEILIGDLLRSLRSLR